MANRTVAQPATRAQLPVSTGSETFTVKGQRYEILRFEGKGPTLAQTIAIAESMQGKQMLTLKEARAIIDDSESNAAFRNALNPGEWAYIRDQEAEGLSCASCLDHDGDYGMLYAGDCCMPDVASQVVILKVTSEAGAKPEQSQADASASTLHLRQGEILAVTLADGVLLVKQLHLNATKATIRRE
jgi:hypothetical protein